MIPNSWFKWDDMVPKVYTGRLQVPGYPKIFPIGVFSASDINLSKNGRMLGLRNVEISNGLLVLKKLSFVLKLPCLNSSLAQVSKLFWTHNVLRLANPHSDDF
jgi:hypothetical protein